MSAASFMRFFIGCLIMLFLSAFTTDFSHKYYHSYSTFELNKKTRNAEVVIEVFWHDLEFSVSKFSGKAVKCAGKEFPGELKKYLAAHFLLKNKIGEETSAQLVGQEIKNDEMMIYLEYPGITTFDGAQLENKLMIKEFPDQVNQVSVKSTQGKKSIVFNSRNFIHSLN